MPIEELETETPDTPDVCPICSLTFCSHETDKVETQEQVEAMLREFTSNWTGAERWIAIIRVLRSGLLDKRITPTMELDGELRHTLNVCGRGIDRGLFYASKLDLCEVCYKEPSIRAGIAKPSRGGLME